IGTQPEPHGHRRGSRERSGSRVPQRPPVPVRAGLFARASHGGRPVRRVASCPWRNTLTIILLFMVIMGSYVCVRIGAVALELTGIPWERAKFQALSAFTNCGFTTSEAEDIVRHPLRRSIVSYLMILGNAGIVTTIGTFAGTIVGTNLRDALVRLAILGVV